MAFQSKQYNICNQTREEQSWGIHGTATYSSLNKVFLLKKRKEKERVTLYLVFFT